jgi:hypothetical protein
MIAWKYAGAYVDQPAYDMSIYSIIRQHYLRLKKADMDRQMKKARNGMNKKYGRR